MSSSQPAVLPFWFWNGDLDEAAIDAQLAEAVRSGYAGLAVHARVGNRIPYLGPRWMELVRHAALGARRLGLELWIYDEENFPSGTAGHRVQGADPALRQATLAWTRGRAADLRAIAEPIACFALAALDRPCAATDLPDTAEALLFHVERTQRYVDTLAPAACSAFIASTHEAYAAALGDLLGTVVTAVYTDDVNYHLQDRLGLGWTADLPAEFLRRRGRELLPSLPALIADLPGAAAVRIDFHRTLLELFLERWVAPQREWCARRGLRWLGHLRGDEGPLWQLAEQCGAAMPYYAAEDVPSIDDYLLRARDGGFARRARTDFGLSPALLYRQAASVADQFKDGIVNSEVGASFGWDASPAELHRHLLFQQLMGINQLTHHAVYAATAGAAKRDHPPSWSTQLPWWELGTGLVARWSRLCGWLRTGTASVGTLVLFPTTAAWACLRGADRRPAAGLPLAGDAPSCDGIEDGLAELCLALVRARIGFHFGDELLLAEHGTAEDGTLRLGRMRYARVVVPDAPAWQPSTTALIARCRAAGIPVERVDGDPTALASRLPADLAFSAPPDSAEVVVHARAAADGPHYLLANCGDTDAGVSPAPGPGTWVIEALEGDAPVYRGPLPAVGLVLERDACWRIRRGHGPALAAAPRPGSEALLLNGWRWRTGHPTVAWWDGARDATGVWRRLRDLDGRTCGPLEIPITVPAGVELRGLLGEQLASIAPAWDGRPLPLAGMTRHPASRDLAVLPLEGVDPGAHLLRIDPSRLADRIEDIGLLLDGMVVPVRDATRGWQPSLAPWREPVVGCDLAVNGLPFHWGAVIARAEVDLIDPTGWDWLDLGAVAGAVRVQVNGEPVADLDHGPWTARVAGRLRPGRNAIEVRVLGTAQNLFGPHRNPRLGRTISAPPEGDARAPDDPYVLAPFGILGAPCLRRSAPSR